MRQKSGTKHELDNFRGGHGKAIKTFEFRRFFLPVSHFAPFCASTLRTHQLST
jgi:hypothetical protein